MARSASEQALVDYILNSIRTRSTNELMDYHSKMDVTLKEMMNNGLSASQINGLPVDFIRLFIEDGNISLEDLEDAGVDDQVIQGVNPNYTSTILEPEPIFEPINETFTPIMDPSQNNGFSEIQSKESILEDVRNNIALIADLQEALNRRVINSNDLANLGFSYEFIDRLQQYEPQSAIYPKFSDLPPIREDSSDIYFLGMPGSGKSTMLAALFSYCNEIGVMGNIVDNQFGNKYRNQLVLGMAQGFLPNSTPTEFINFIPVDMQYHGQTNSQQLNFIDMAGEKFRSVANEGIQEFAAYKNYLNNNNPKCLIFVMDFFENNKVEALKQDQNLQQVLALLEKFGILKKAEAVYLVVTKADLFPSANKQEYADQYISSKYRNFLNACMKAKKTYKFVLKSFPYSIGPAKFSYILEDCNQETNSNLVEYPKLLLEQLENDMAYKKGNRLGSWFGK